MSASDLQGLLVLACLHKVLSRAIGIERPALPVVVDVDEPLSRLQDTGRRPVVINQE